MPLIHVSRRSMAALMALLAVAGAGQAVAQGALPGRDLTVEFRQMEEGYESAGKRYSAAASGPSTWEPQRVQVRNGEKASLQIQDAIPMQWTESVGTQNSSVSGGSASASTTGASVKFALQWFDAGQSLTVTPRWPGGSKPAVLEIEVQRASAEPQTHGSLATQSRSSLRTTVTVPLAEWVTVAATGQAPASNTYSSAAATQQRRLLQVRVMAP